MSKKKSKFTPKNENNQENEKKKMGRFGKLYIAAAICTACICVLVLAITARISDFMPEWDKKATVSLPTCAPIDSLIQESVTLPTPAPTKTPELKSIEERYPSPTPEVAKNDTEIKAEKAVETGLFKKDIKIKLLIPVAGEILNECSLDALKKSKTLGDWRTHNGIDIKADMSSAVNAAASGTVVLSEYDTQMGYVVKIEHEGGYETLYSNLASNEMVEAGQKINAGECLGAIGDSAVFEKLEESHLHFELKKDGKYLNPMEYME